MVRFWKGLYRSTKWGILSEHDTFSSPRTTITLPPSLLCLLIPLFLRAIFSFVYSIVIQAKCKEHRDHHWNHHAQHVRHASIVGFMDGMGYFSLLCHRETYNFIVQQRAFWIRELYVLSSFSCKMFCRVNIMYMFSIRSIYLNTKVSKSYVHTRTG